jgi:hypothetical protein
MPHPLDTIAGLLVIASVAIACYLRTDPDAPERTAVAMIGSTFLVFTPSYGWYAALLVLLVAMTRQVEWLPVAFAPTFVYLLDNSVHPPSWALRLVYLGAAVAALGTWVVRLQNLQDHAKQQSRHTKAPTSRPAWQTPAVWFAPVRPFWKVEARHHRKDRASLPLRGDPARLCGSVGPGTPADLHGPRGAGRRGTRSVARDID